MSKITRTSFTTHYSAVIVNIANRTFDDIKGTVNGNYNSEDAIDKLKKELEKDGTIVVGLEITEISSELREMSEGDWMKYSKPVEKKTEFSSRGRKPKTDK